MIHELVKKKERLCCTYVLHGSCEDDDFVNLGHLGEELVAARPDKERALAAHFKVVDERLVEIKDEAVAGASFLLWEIWWIWRDKRLVSANGCATHSIEWRQVGILLESLDLLACLDDVVSHLAQRAVVKILQSFADDDIERPQGGTCHVGALQEALAPHLEQSLR